MNKHPITITIVNFEAVKHWRHVWNWTKLQTKGPISGDNFAPNRQMVLITNQMTLSY